MPKLQTVTTNFTAGEFSPRLRGRVDIEKFNSSAEKLENIVVLRQGGATIRPSRDWKGEVKVSAQTVRILPFVYSRTDAYLLELGDLYLRIWKGGVLIESSPGVPYEVATPWTQAQLAALDFTQGADTLIIAHPSVPTQRIRRFADAQWAVEAAPFNPPAIYESGHRNASISLTISNVAIGAGRTLTASAGFWLQADVGRTVVWGTGVALITSYTSATVVTVTVTAAFPAAVIAGPNWLLEGTPQTANTPGVPALTGSATTMTLAVAGWRAEDVGKYVKIKAGLVEITGFTSSTIVAGVIVQDLTPSPDAAEPGAWILQGPVWDSVNGYPSSCTLFQQRLWLGGTAAFPQSKWGSRSALFFDFLPGTTDEAAVYKTIDSDDINVIQYLASLETLIALTYGGEFETRGGVEKPITQTNAQIKKLSKWGSDPVRPEEVGDGMMFVQRGGRAIRLLAPGQIDGYTTRDVSVFSEHLLADGVQSMAWEQAPEQVLWVATGAGALLAVTYSEEQNLVAFCSGNAEGVVEWLASIPDGSRDATYALVRYTVGGVTRRYIERLNWDAPPGQDSRRQYTGPAATVWPGFGHLEGKTVAVLADDIFVGSAVVTGGSITLPRAATKVSAGLPYAARLLLQAPEVGTGTGTAQGQAQATNSVWVRFLDTVGCKVNGQVLAFRQFGDGILDQPIPPFTGIKQVTDYGWRDGESPLEIVQDQPYPWTVLAVVRNFTVNVG